MTDIYCDIADIKLVRKFNKKKIVKGFTTNPSLMAKAGARNYKKYSQKILRLTSKPVSCEVFADNENEMIIQGELISKWAGNVYVKVPIFNSKGKFMGKVISVLNKQKIKINITAVYSIEQVKRILKILDKKTKVIISIFAGRMGDVGKDPLPIFKESLKLTRKFKNVKILWASTREPYNYTQARYLKCEHFGKTFTDLTVDTVRGFLKDSKKSKFKI